MKLSLPTRAWLVLPLLLTCCATLALPPAAIAQNGPPPLMTGTAWYPEQWPESRWEQDLTLMQQAHMHFVRVGEFAWNKMEPAEGQYDFDWLERAVNLAGKHGIYVVLGTPTATPPAWLTQKYPETLRVDDNGRRDEHGNRAQYNWANPKYREFARDIASRMAKRLGHNPYVVGWQIDNEYSQTSTDLETQKMFQDWLRTYYGTLDNMNQRWSGEYWSEGYSDWSQIPIPLHGGIDSGNPGLLLSWRRFTSDTWRSYQKNQIDAIRAECDPRMFITTNTMGFFVWYDHYVPQQDLDMSAWDDYFSDGKVDPAGNGAAHDLTRGFKGKNFWVMETQPAFVNWASVNPALAPGAVRAAAWHAVAHGADAVGYWQWRSALNGQEQYHGTLVGPDGTPVPVYPEIQRTGAEFDRAGAALKDTHVESQVAILHSYESRWAIEWQPQSSKFDPVEQLVSYYRPLRNIAQSVDIIPATRSLSQYKLVVAPAYNLLTKEEAQNLIAYVNGGGNLVLGPRSGMKDVDNALQVERQPGPLVPLLGGRVEQYYSLTQPTPADGKLGNLTAEIWGEALSTKSPDDEVLLSYGKANGWLDHVPAIITRKVGKGSITYVGACFNETSMKILAAWMAKTAGLTTPLPNVPEGVEASQRIGANHVVTILVNFSGSEKDVPLPTSMDNVLEGGKSSTVHLANYGVAVLDRPQ